MGSVVDARDEKRGYDDKRIDELISSWVSAEIARRAGSSRKPLNFKKTIGAVLLLVAVASVSANLYVSISDDLVGGSKCGNLPASAIPTPRNVALIDELASEQPNPGFVERIESTARNAGYGFDYVPPETATLDFFINLPTKDYALIILRTHATVVSTSAIVTSDAYDQYRRVGDQMLNRLGAVNVSGSLYFGLMPDFITQVMCGRFPGTLILGMGCNLMSQTVLAKAFVDKGASAFVGWNRVVTVSHTDIAFGQLSELLLKGGTITEAVQETIGKVGADPSTGAELAYYPTDDI